MPDYTKMRLSKTIRVCPKCERKGQYRHMWMDDEKRGYRATWDSYKHITEMTGLGFESVREHCTVNYERVPLNGGSNG